MAATQTPFWRERLHVPAYRVLEAARYARTTPQTVSNWQRVRGNHVGAIGDRAHRAGLSYLQLIELGVVAAMRKSGVSLSRIRQAREYLSNEFDSQYPFAQFRFKTDGKSLFMAYDQIVAGDKEKLLALNESGQLAWNQILQALLQEFEYDAEIGAVQRWKVAGVDSPIQLDPRVAFGAPHVEGVPTWVLQGRWESGESLADIAADYGLKRDQVASALRFEGVVVDPSRTDTWLH